MKRGCQVLSIFFVLMAFSCVANAGLIVIGTATYNGEDYNLVYEDDQGLIWLDYSNRKTGGWENSIKWAAGLNMPGVLTYKLSDGMRVSWDDEWRLPKTVDGKRKWGNDGTTTAGFNITTSEMGHLYYISLGNLGHVDTGGDKRSGYGDDAVWGLKNKGPFTKLFSDSYWSGTDYSAQNQHAWSFSFNFGSQGNGNWKNHYDCSALAVRSGRVVSSTVR